jgi:gluconate 2-dehydrogenase subunit 3-like protein
MSDDARELPDQPDETTVSPKVITRRRALQVLGAVPVAAALGQQAPGQQQKPLTPGVTSQVPTAPTAAPTTAAAVPHFFNNHEWKTVRVLVDYVIPRDKRSGSATDAKVPEYIDYLLSEKDASLNTQTAWRGGLAWIDTESHNRFGRTFIQATDAQRRQILDDIAYPDKAKPEMRHGVVFFNRLRDMTASGFFSSAMGWQDVQYVGNVFNPAYDGCPPAALEKLGVSYDLMQTRVSPQSK